MESSCFHPEGTPQGGIISPLLANIALHGMESRIKQAIPKANFIRYADDFVILHKDITVVQRCRDIISEWLKGMGLELKSSKTRLLHTLNGYEGNRAGFDFLGFTIRQLFINEICVCSQNLSSTKKIFRVSE